MTQRPQKFEQTRRSLLVRMKNWEDQASWQEFFDSYWKLIYSSARKSGLTEEEAQDTVQETILAVAKNIKSFNYDPARCTFKSWLRLITQQRIIWQLRKRPPSNRPLSPSCDLSDRTSTIEKIADPAGQELEEIWDTEWETNLMSAALERVRRQVKPRQFQIFDLYVLQNWPVREVAKTLRISAARVYLAKHRISGLLKKEVKQLEGLTT